MSKDDFWKALSNDKEVTNRKHQRSVRICQEIPEQVKHEKLTKLHYWKSALNSYLDIVLDSVAIISRCKNNCSHDFSSFVAIMIVVMA